MVHNVHDGTVKTESAACCFKSEEEITMKIGVIGAGTMGSGIAQAFAQTEGYEVVLCDINEEFAANGKKKDCQRI